MNARTILSVAYPLAPVGDDAVGGAEQVLTMIERGIVRAGYRSIVIAAEGSRCEGELVAVPRADGVLDERARVQAQRRHEAAISEVLARTRVDLIHVHGHDFDRYLPGAGPSLLATLHCPPSWYAPAVFELERARSYLNCVSDSQRASCSRAANVVATIANGVDLDALRPGDGRGDYVLALGRVSPEKGFDRALDAARRADLALVLAGQVFAYPEHQRYFAEQVQPRLDAKRRFIGPVGRDRKRELLGAARCLVAPSEIAETSSLVAMEALACGTPVVTSSGAGALADIVEHGRTGFVVGGDDELVVALGEVSRIDRSECRRAAERRFSARRMIGEYLALYERLLAV